MKKKPPGEAGGCEREARCLPAGRAGSATAGQARGYFFAAFGTYPGEALNAFTSAPSATFHTRTSPSYAPPATSLPSGLTATANT